MRVGGVKLGAANWLWQTEPTVTSEVPLVKDGRFDIGDDVTYAGSAAMASGQNIVCAYHGEFWNQTEANQFMHYWDDGLFLGQFGVPNSTDYDPNAIGAGKAGNAFSPTLVDNDGELYLYNNDESNHAGVQRWHLLNVGAVREQIATGTSGTTISLTAPAAPFPTHVQALAGNESVALSWNAVSGAGYDIEVSQTLGGPYQTVASGVNGTSYTVTGLTNDEAYYFVVDATNSTAGTGASVEVQATPINPAVAVHKAGQMMDNRLGHNITGIAAAGGLATLTDIDNVSGNLSIYQVGQQGFEIFDFAAGLLPVAQFASPIGVTVGSGWTTENYVVDPLSVNGVSPYANPWINCLMANPVGQILITPSDTQWHYVTVMSPSRSTNSRAFSISLAPSDGSSAASTYTVNDTETTQSGVSRVFQFLFRGNVTLTVNNTGGELGTVQGLFFDNVAEQNAQLPSPPEVVNPAASASNPVTGTTAALSVLGSDASGESNLTYTWSASASSPAPVTFSANGTNSAKNTTATFSQAGTYQLSVTIKNQNSETASSSVTVTVAQSASSISVTPAAATLTVGSSQTFSSNVKDQFQKSLAIQPSVKYTASGNGSFVGLGGTFTASTAGGPVAITAILPGVTGSATVTITSSPSFSLSTTSSAVSSGMVGNVQNVVNLASSGGFSGTVALSVSGLPAGVTSTFSSSTVNGTGHSILTMIFGKTVHAGTSTITVTGTSGSTVKQTTFKLTVP
jgi:hypothetical protein